MQDNSLWIE